MDWVWIVLGLAALVASAELLLKGAVWTALAFGISPKMVGLTLVAFGTSVPELIVSVQAGWQGAPGIALGNVLGSNVANIGLIVGLAALIRPIPQTWSPVRFETGFMVAFTIVTTLALLPFAGVGRGAGAAMVATTVVFTLTLIRRERTGAKDGLGEARPQRTGRGLALHVGMMLVGFAGLPIAARWLVEGGSNVATALGVGEQVIGLTIVALGTSLPELATSMTAAKRGHPEIALGNVLGSNVFNIGMVLGGTAVISPLPIDWAKSGLGFFASCAFAVALLLTLRLAPSGRLGRRFGLAMLVAYGAYLATEVVNDRIH